MIKELSWKPVLRGPIYCSSACGAGCKKADYDLACKQSAALAKRLGAGWKARVAENLHWYWSVDKAGLRVSPSCPGQYVVILNADGLSFVEHGKNPRSLVNAALATVDEHISNLQQQRKRMGKSL